MSRSSDSTLNTFKCPFVDRCGCNVKFRIFATAFNIKLESQGEHSAESHVQDKVTKFLSIPQTAALEQMVATNPMVSATSVLRGSSCFRIPQQQFPLPSYVLLLVRSLRRVCGHCSHSLMARNWTAMKAVLLVCLKRYFCTPLWRSTIEVASIWSCTNRSVWVINSRTV